MPPTDSNDSALLAAFIAAFDIPKSQRGDPDSWHPVAVTTDPSGLARLYRLLPGPFPPLYEQLLLSYRWPTVALPNLTLLANPQGKTLVRLLTQIHYADMWETLVRYRYIPFARGWGGSYDPVCFDLNHRREDGDCPLVRFDHEQIMIFERLREVEVIADSFRAMVLATVNGGNSQGKR